MNNDKSNLSIVTQKYNRTEPRKRNEEREPQDKDIADRKGTQPAKYFKGLKNLLSPREMHTLKRMMVKVHTRMLRIKKQERNLWQNLSILKIIMQHMEKSLHMRSCIP